MYATLAEISPTFSVPALMLAEAWDKIPHVEGLAEQILDALVDDHSIPVSDMAVLEALGLAVVNIVESATEPIFYRVVRRMTNGGFVKIFCSCKGFTFHGHCYH